MNCLPRPHLMVALLAPIGCLCRIALTKIETLLIDDEHSEALSALGSGYFFANIAGCIAMSLVLKYRGAIMKLDTALYVGFSTGFCGCLTTFSTWSQRISLLLVHGSVFDGLVVLLLMHTCAWVSLNFANTFIWPTLTPRSAQSPSFQPNNKPARKTIDVSTMRKVSGKMNNDLMQGSSANGGRARSLTLPDSFSRQHQVVNSTSEEKEAGDVSGPPQYMPESSTSPSSLGLKTISVESNREEELPVVPSSMDDVLQVLSDTKNRKILARSTSVSRTRSESKTDTRIRNNSVKSSTFAGDLVSSFKRSNDTSFTTSPLIEMMNTPTHNPVLGDDHTSSASSTSLAPSGVAITPYVDEPAVDPSKRKNTRERAMSEEKRRQRALSGAVYSKKSTRRRENTLGLDFMSEEEHLRFVMKRVQLLDKGGTGDDSIEGYATDETILNTIRCQVLHLADAYKEYIDDFEVMESAAVVQDYDHENSFIKLLFGSCLPYIVTLLGLLYSVSAILCLVYDKDDLAVLFFSLAFAPFGALIRYRLGLMNKKYKTFPVFTLVANIGGCLVTVAMYAILLSTSDRVTTVICSGISTGFSGSLSTVSTLMAEARALPDPRLLMRYLGVTYFLAQAVLFLINLPLALHFGGGI